MEAQSIMLKVREMDKGIFIELGEGYVFAQQEGDELVIWQVYSPNLALLNVELRTQFEDVIECFANKLGLKKISWYVKDRHVNGSLIMFSKYKPKVLKVKIGVDL